MRRAMMVGALAGLTIVPARAEAQEQRFEVGGQIVVAEAGEFDGDDTGGGFRVGWRAQSLVGIEAEVNFYPSELPSGTAPISTSRTEALFGATIGPRLGSLRPFVRVRPGLLRYAEAPGPIVCIAIFPPPLSCQLAAGRTLFAFDIGGGLDVDIGRRMLFRLDVGDRVVRYPEPFDAGHDVRVGIGWAVRF